MSDEVERLLAVNGNQVARIDQLDNSLRAAHRREKHYRQALVRIADAESGVWGRIAYEALHPKRASDG